MQMCTRFQLCQLVLTRVPSRSVLRACDVRRVCIVRRAALLLGKRYNKGRYTSGHKPGTTTALTLCSDSTRYFSPKLAVGAPRKRSGSVGF